MWLTFTNMYRFGRGKRFLNHSYKVDSNMETGSILLSLGPSLKMYIHKAEFMSNKYQTMSNSRSTLLIFFKMVILVTFEY